MVSWTVLAISLGLTLLLELPAAWLLGVRGRHDFLVAVAVNTLTNPAAVVTFYLLRSATGAPTLTIQLPMEMAVMAVEALCYWRCAEKIEHPVRLAVLLNLWSYSAGLLLNLLV